MNLDVSHVRTALRTLERAAAAVQQTVPTDPLYDVYRLAVIKSFELTIELTAKLLRKTLREYAGSARAVDGLSFNELFRLAGQSRLLDAAAVGRWLAYRANRNSTAHDYGEEFVRDTLQLLPTYVRDADAVLDIVAGGSRGVA